MTVLIVYNAPEVGASAADMDVLTQVEWLEATLHHMAIDCQRCGCTLNFTDLDVALMQIKPTVVFNLVESLAGSDARAYLAAEFIEARQLPMTGSSATTLKQLISKSGVKQRFLAWDMPTPAWMDNHGVMHGEFAPDRFIIKADLEHASIGICDESIVEARDVVDLSKQLEFLQSTSMRTCLAERFVCGREFNVSLLENENGSAEVLPLAEIDFSHLPHRQPRIVGWRAKWDKRSFEFHNTPRKFPDFTEQPELAMQLRELAIACWNHLELNGYARVDFRVSQDNQPWILEVNANPCLSPDAGFYAAARRGGLSDEAIANRIISAAMHAPLRRSR